MKRLMLLFCMIYFNAIVVFAQGNLNSIFTSQPPVVDGTIDALWDGAPELTIALGETYDVHDPASVTDCAGCHAFNSDISVKLKSVYTADKVYMLATWPDPTASFTRGGSWSFANGAWEKPNSTQSEDRISFFWPMGEITGTYNTGGCMSKCHMYYPTDTDPHVSSHGIVDDAWLVSGRADMWHSKAARGGAYLGATGSNLTIDAATHEVTAGTLSMLGFADDKYVDMWAHDSLNGEDGGRYGDAGVSAYSHNRIGDKSRPKYMEKAPVDYADAMFLTQDEIDAGECVGDGTTGVTDADATTYWSVYAGFNAVVPERIIRNATGSRGDLAFGAVWQDGMWTAEIARDLNTGNADDVQFDTAQQYKFNVAEFDNSRHGYEHRTSKTFTLRFDLSDAVDEQNTAPTTFALEQNYPNPFNPQTTIAFSIPENSRVTVDIFTVLGQHVQRLIDADFAAGKHRLQWNATDSRGKQMSGGLYIYRLRAGQYVQSRKMLLLK